MDNSIPALERGLAVLHHLAEHDDGVTAGELGEAIEVPRATLYRILRVLRAHEFVLPTADDASRLVLGPGLARLARHVRGSRDLVATLQPAMDRLAESIGETVKLVVREDAVALTVAVSHSGNDSRIAARIGTRLPLYLGASQRLLLASAPAKVVDRVLAGRLDARASRTLTDAPTIRRGLPALRRRGWASTHSEGVEGVGAFAAAIVGLQAECLAALVAVYVHAGKSAAERARIKSLTLEAAKAAAEALN